MVDAGFGRGEAASEAKSCRYQWRIQDFPQGVCQLPKLLLFFKLFGENCMKMKEFGPLWGCASLVSPLALPICGWGPGPT